MVRQALTMYGIAGELLVLLASLSPKMMTLQRDCTMSQVVAGTVLFVCGWGLFIPLIIRNSWRSK